MFTSSSTGGWPLTLHLTFSPTGTLPAVANDPPHVAAQLSAPSADAERRHLEMMRHQAARLSPFDGLQLAHGRMIA